MRANPSHPVVRGVDFALDTQEGGADEVYFIPDSDDEGYGNWWKLEGAEDEFVLESEPQPLEGQAAAVQGNISPATPGVDGDRQDRNQRWPLGYELTLSCSLITSLLDYSNVLSTCACTQVAVQGMATGSVPQR